MFTPLLSEVLDKITSYLTGSADDRELEGWIVANLQRILDSGDPEAIHLTDEVDASFIELGEGIIDRSSFKKRLTKLVAETSTTP